MTGLRMAYTEVCSWMLRWANDNPHGLGEGDLTPFFVLWVFNFRSPGLQKSACGLRLRMVLLWGSEGAVVEFRPPRWRTKGRRAPAWARAFCFRGAKPSLRGAVCKKNSKIVGAGSGYI